MRPVNLIPADERGGARKSLRGGPFAYLVVGALVAALVGISALVITNNQISSQTAEIAELKEETAAAETQATRLAAYTQFHTVSAQRSLTIANLASSRFDWEKVMRQLALVFPDDVSLTNLTGSVRPDVSVGGGESVGMRGSIAGPALAMVGCAAGQEAVASFITALKDIDGVTRVGLQASQLPTSESGGSESASGGCAEELPVSFQIVVAFDAAPVPIAASTPSEVVAAPTEEGSSEESSTETTAAPEGE